MAAWGQDEPADEAAKAPPPLGGVFIHGQGPTDPARVREALAGLDAFTDLDSAESAIAISRLLMETGACPGSRLALLALTENNPVVAARVPGQLPDESDKAGHVRWWNGDGVVYLLYSREAVDLDDAAAMASAFDALEEAFKAHRGNFTSGVELMLDLESLRRGWPESLADGPARRVVAKTSMANARKVHVHIPEAGPTRLAYSTRAQPPESVRVRTGPRPRGLGGIGISVPNLIDNSIGAYMSALEVAENNAFAQRFQEWMAANRASIFRVVMAPGTGFDWTLTHTETGLRLALDIPVQDGVDATRIFELGDPSLATLGFVVEEERRVFHLPQDVARAVGGTKVWLEVDTEAEPAIFRVVME